jgi:riboflavin kinase/FMN adenylyltransferase
MHHRPRILLLEFETMQLLRYKDHRFYDASGNIPLDAFHAEPSAITIGTYDGVHVGHRKLIAELTRIAAQKNMRSVLITFEPHPRLVVGKKDSQTVKLLTTLDEKIALLRPLGLDTIVVIEFTKAFSETPPDVFVQAVLMTQLGLSEMVIGYDHGFGKNRQGTIDTLRQLANTGNFGITVVEEQTVGGAHLSSTVIRERLEHGLIEEANQLLGSAYHLSGTVTRGEARGRTIGFPTANVSVANAHKLIPKRGVYVCDALVLGHRFRAMTNIGYRPTVADESRLSIETHLLDFNGDLYGKSISIEFLSRLRDEQKFSSMDALKAQLEADKQATATYSKELLWN